MAALIGGAIGGIGSLIGSGKEASAIEQAGQDQEQAAEYSANLQNQAEQQVLGYAAPYRSSGTVALSQLGAGTASGGEFNSTPTAAEVMQNDPGYQFNLQQGQLALQQAQAAGGGVGSGGALKAASQYATNYTTNAYQNAYNQFMNTRQANYSNLSQLAGLGLSATGLSGSAAMTGAAAQGNYLTQGANAQAASLVGQANVWGGSLSNLGTNLQQAYQQYMNQQSSYNTASATAGNYQGLGVPGGSGPTISLPNLGSYDDYTGDFGTTRG